MQLKAIQVAKLSQLQAAKPAAPLGAEELAKHPVRTFMHQVAGANFIMPDGRKLVFAGKTTLASEGRRAGGGKNRTGLAVAMGAAPGRTAARRRRPRRQSGGRARILWFV